ncbi:unnamed protein product [Polarella glacialis]|uniref:Plastid lipid-associated protein/fibrillin conserved domain-containing protein n=1 Tax=Polarella glacialis TaxID=89957 RepID=A0A813FI16_POLGL|nr:unnamed protein product [Polarella glacialis]CAE8705296.1 unnamed protein product [Polarella glacialis]|mmetsp:Transcript_141/g.261  ORF Transcript_141/g.261 Transcript_141/m.261 type:complete len:255 (-) Transcript_141:258-1022(-)|eukprot:CAMPEP_0115101416 /NCGR_PEP_ID=MMETSP0227-20121206/33219_1 /TAXON_ID=89957 /ORGANISM="Polarella glacialis, Strain CCMP 1383" /LENGTH=254 /DNA_ID=CAMNT_0002497163 /DNA_START=86 /DNA_END=850 /DNA_ORIENTATION=+
MPSRGFTIILLTAAVLKSLHGLSLLKSAAFCGQRIHHSHRSVVALHAAESERPSRFEDSEGVASKGIVSSLTNLVNSFSSSGPSLEESSTSPAAASSPASPQELLERIREDYTVKNYLWTGDIDLSAFDRQCQFTDPTLSFTGTDQFVKNLQNLRPIVDALTRPGGCRSDLLDIQLFPDQGYIQTRWNMIGELSALPWKPQIDVIGRTKFWYRADEQAPDERFNVFFYDEEWEIPAGKALLQLITPAGTIPNSG